MIRGYFQGPAFGARAFVSATLTFPSLGNRSLPLALLIDTGADRTVLGPDDVLRLRVDMANLPEGLLVGGVGGSTRTRAVDAVLHMDDYSLALVLTVFLPSPRLLTMPSLLGRDVLSHFALVMEERTQRVLLLEPEEADRLAL